MKQNPYATVKLLLLLLMVYVVAASLGFVGLLIAIKLLVFLKEGVPIQCNAALYFKSLQLGAPLGGLIGIGHWLFYRFGLR